MLLEPRKRPHQQRSAATVDAILEAAARILERRGLDALTTNAVAALAGVSIGSLYQYFPGKAAILAELIRRERLILLAGIDRLSSVESLHSLNFGSCEGWREIACGPGACSGDQYTGNSVVSTTLRSTKLECTPVTPSMRVRRLSRKS